MGNASVPGFLVFVAVITLCGVLACYVFDVAPLAALGVCMGSIALAFIAVVLFYRFERRV